MKEVEGERGKKERLLRMRMKKSCIQREVEKNEEIIEVVSSLKYMCEDGTPQEDVKLKD